MSKEEKGLRPITPQCHELEFYQAHPIEKSQVFKKLFLILQADFPDFAKIYDQEIFNPDGTLKESGELQDFYNERKSEIFLFLQPFLKQAYQYLVYCYTTLSKGQDYNKLFLEKDFKEALDNVYERIMDKKDIRSLYRYAQTKDFQLTGHQIPKRIYELLRKESEVSPLLALMMTEVYSLIDRISPTTEALLILQNNSLIDNLFNLKTPELAQNLNFSVDLSPSVRDLSERIYLIRELILAEHHRLGQLFQYDVKEEKYYFCSDVEEGQRKIFLKSIKMRLKKHQSMIRKIFHTIFDPAESEDKKYNMNITDYIGIMFEIESQQDREDLVTYLRENGFFNLERQSEIIKVSTSIQNQVRAIFKGEQFLTFNDSLELTQLQIQAWLKASNVIQTKFKVNPNSVDDYSVTSFKSKLFYFENDHDFIGEEIFIITAAEKEVYDKSHIPFRIEQITKFIYRFAGLSEIFFRKSFKKQKS